MSPDLRGRPRFTRSWAHGPGNRSGGGNFLFPETRFVPGVVG